MRMEGKEKMEGDIVLMYSQQLSSGLRVLRAYSSFLSKLVRKGGSE